MEKKWVFRLFLLLVTVICMIACAKQGALSGGPKDETPPQPDLLRSDPNFRTQSRPKQITLYFNEWIQLRNSSQILISPPLEHNPEITSKGKRVEIKFNEKELLRDSTTYSINFGNAITDFTESNPLSNYQFVFSTGDVIDSLVMQGTVVDAYSKKPVEKVSVMLYDQDVDSIVYREKPYYFASTDKNGKFTIRYIRKGKFKCFALQDADFNFIYNQDKEQIGFIDSLIEVTSDEFVTEVFIEIFLPEPKAGFTEFGIPQRGKIKLRANKPVKDFTLDTINVPVHHLEVMADSVMIWYQPGDQRQDSVSLVYTFEGIRDTLAIKSKASANRVGPPTYANSRYRKKFYLPGEITELTFNQPIDSIDLEMWRLEMIRNLPRVEDSTQLMEADTLTLSLPLVLEIDSVSRRQINMEAPMDPAERYSLSLLPGAVRGYYQQVNDTLTSEMSFEKKENLGNIICRFDSLDAKSQYVVRLKLRDLVMKEDVIGGAVSMELKYEWIKPGKYSLEIIEDANKNGRWDPGNYLEKKQSERVLEVKLEELRKNWDIESEIKWDGNETKNR